MNEDFVTYELAVKLKEKGFREKCFAYYSSYSGTLHYNEIKDAVPSRLTVTDFGKCHNYFIGNVIDAPAISQVLKWFRKKKIYIVIAVNPTLSTKDKIAYYYQVYSNSNGVTSDYYESEECYAQWEDCAIESIKSVLKYLI
jgi:hypothetical protein